mmetsp:Transcript_47332/g.151936  ORF Transcript_47332/g.151936 Transcript_47332/m.151936 type:complete len:426 (+) Transcript_47332:337-1614(+)
MVPTSTPEAAGILAAGKSRSGVYSRAGLLPRSGRCARALGSTLGFQRWHRSARARRERPAELLSELGACIFAGVVSLRGRGLVAGPVCLRIVPGLWARTCRHRAPLRRGLRRVHGLRHSRGLLGGQPRSETRLPTLLRLVHRFLHHQALQQLLDLALRQTHWRNRHLLAVLSLRGLAYPGARAPTEGKQWRTCSDTGSFTARKPPQAFRLDVVREFRGSDRGWAGGRFGSRLAAAIASWSRRPLLRRSDCCFRLRHRGAAVRTHADVRHVARESGRGRAREGARGRRRRGEPIAIGFVVRGAGRRLAEPRPAGAGGRRGRLRGINVRLRLQLDAVSDGRGCASAGLRQCLLHSHAGLHVGLARLPTLRWQDRRARRQPGSDCAAALALGAGARPTRLARAGLVIAVAAGRWRRANCPGARGLCGF